MKKQYKDIRSRFEHWVIFKSCSNTDCFTYYQFSDCYYSNNLFSQLEEAKATPMDTFALPKFLLTII